MNDENYHRNNVIAFPQILTDKMINTYIEPTPDGERDEIWKIADDLLISQPISQALPQEEIPIQKKSVFSSARAWLGNMKQKAKSFFSKFKL